MKKLFVVTLTLLFFSLLYINSFGFSIDDYNDIDDCLPQYENALRYIVEEKAIMGGHQRHEVFSTGSIETVRYTRGFVQSF